MNFKGKIALVTGASRGIGRAISEILAFREAKVIGTATSEYGVEIINNYLGKKGKGLILNVTDSKSVSLVFQKIRKEFGNVDILINNAGITRDSLLLKMKEDDWKNVIETNLLSVFRLSKEVIWNMIRKRYGRIINIGSIVGTIGNAGQTNYAAAKAGLIGFSKSLAIELAPRKITVNVISPGFIETDMIYSLKNKKDITALSKIPAIRRLGFPNEVANVVAFLASDEASYITGEIIHVSGGTRMI